MLIKPGKIYVDGGRYRYQAIEYRVRVFVVVNAESAAAAEAMVEGEEVFGEDRGETGGET